MCGVHWMKEAANPYQRQEGGRFGFAPGGAKRGPQALARPGMGDTGFVDAKTAAEMKGGSAEAHLVDNGDGTFRFSDERQALHDEIVRRELAGKQRVANPMFNIMGGGSASGKSTVQNGPLGQSLGLSESPTNLLVNSDDLKMQVPEAAEMMAQRDTRWAAFAHEESSYLAKRVQAAGFEHGTNVTLDGTGDSSPDKLRGKINAARSHGYGVRGVYVTVPTEMAVERARIRGQGGDMRVVDPVVVRSIHASVSQTFPAVARDFDSSVLYDTRGGQGDVREVYSWDGATETISDPVLWNEFLAKAQEGS